MDRNIELLNYIYQNAKMGTDTITALMQKVSSPQLRSDLSSQLNSYQGYLTRAVSLMSEYSHSPTDNSFISKISSQMGIAFNTAINSEPEHIAEMMINGSTMGVIDLTKKLKEYTNCDQRIITLAQELSTFEQQTIERLKTFL